MAGNTSSLNPIQMALLATEKKSNAGKVSGMLGKGIRERDKFASNDSYNNNHNYNYKNCMQRTPMFTTLCWCGLRLTRKLRLPTTVDLLPQKQAPNIRKPSASKITAIWTSKKSVVIKQALVAGVISNLENTIFHAPPPPLA